MKRLVFKYLLLLFFLLAFSSHSFSGAVTPDSLLIKYQDAKNDSIKVQALREIINYWKTVDSDSIVFYSKILIQEALNQDDIQNAFKGYYWVINVYGEKSEYDSALHYAFSGLKHYLNEGISYPSTVILTLIGEQYRAMAQHENAITYLKQAWTIADTGNQNKLQPVIANRLAAVYYEKGMLDSALSWADASVSLSVTYNSTEYVVSNQLIKGAVKRDKENYQEALKSFNEALLMARTSPEDYDLSNILNNIATTYSLMDDWNNVIKFAEESYLNSTSKNLKALTMVSTELLANAYNKIGNYQQAYKFLSIYEHVRNDIFFEERDQQISELNTKYKVQQKENQIKIQKINIGKKDLQIRQNKMITLFFIIVLALLIVFLVFRYRVYKRLKKVNTLIVKQKTEIENYSNKIKDAYTKLQELDEYKQAVTNMLVHDLKNPLNLLVNIDTYKDENEKSDIVAHTSRKMLRLIMNLLDINKAENNNMQLDKTEVNLFDVIQSSFMEIKYLCAQKNISLINKLRFNVYLKADSNILIRVFINLFTNAIKFSPAGGKIIISSEITPDNHLKVSVIDNGPGIAKEYHNTIFEKFRQISNIQSGEMGSSGIGLAYCKLAIESHAWTIGIESEPGKGAEFWLLINDFNIIEDSTTPVITNNHIEGEKVDIMIPKSDLLKIEPYLHQLLKLNVYAISDVKKILLAIKKENIKDLEPWINKVQLATANLNEENFDFLIKSLLK